MILKQGGGSTVELTDRNTVIKTAHDHEQYTKLRNAVRFHTLFGPHLFAPKLLTDNDSSIEMEYIEKDVEVTDMAVYQSAVLRNAIDLLLTLQEHNVIHTDLTAYNYILRKGRLCAVDWSEARFGWETAPNKREGMDADWLYPSLLEYVPDTNRIIRRWLAISPHIKHLRGYGTMLDLGCLYGDISGMAASEGFFVRGIDNGAFDKEWKVVAEHVCKGKVAFYERDIIDQLSFEVDVVLMLSSWSHFVQQHGKNMAIQLLDYTLREGGVLFFENHLKGDGPGIIETEQDHIELFKKLNAAAVPITTIPVGGRPYSRTVYKCMRVK